uniref:Conotoxin n=1 Tax=Conus praecellens TaxID=128530 RepID=A0A291C2S4_CONPC|nr:conotoxin [Conus praecellens]
MAFVFSSGRFSFKSSTIKACVFICNYRLVCLMRRNNAKQK